MLSFALYFFNVIISSKVKLKNKVESYERGFRRVGKVQTIFSIQFFVILLIFLIFDLEIVLLLTTLFISPGMGLILLLLFFFILGGVYIEWFLNKLKWTV